MTMFPWDIYYSIVFTTIIIHVLTNIIFTVYHAYA